MSGVVWVGESGGGGHAATGAGGIGKRQGGEDPPGSLQPALLQQEGGLASKGAGGPRAHG